jgi:hypothetical protein
MPTEEAIDAMTDEEYDDYWAELEWAIVSGVIDLRRQLLAITEELAALRAEAETDNELTEEDRRDALERLAVIAEQVGVDRELLASIEEMAAA